MHKLHELKDMLCEELEEYGSKGKLDMGTLDVVDKLAHAIKNIDKIIEYAEEEDGYSGRMVSDGLGGMSYRRSYAGRRGNVRRDSMGRYSRAEGDFMADLRELMDSAPNDRMRQKIQGIISEMS